MKKCGNDNEVRKMKWKRIPLGPLQTNAYVVIKGKDCVLFDPGSEGEKVIEFIDSLGLKPHAILLTHAHFDHIGGVDVVREKYQIPVYIHVNEKDWLSDSSLNGSIFFMGSGIAVKEANHLIENEGELQVGPFQFSVLETPGHSPGSVSYYSEEAEAVISGDTLFQGSIGRTDLPGGDHQQLMRSIDEKLLSLPEETAVLPGHGMETTLIDEMETNPFLNGFSLG